MLSAVPNNFERAVEINEKRDKRDFWADVLLEEC